LLPKNPVEEAPSCSLKKKRGEGLEPKRSDPQKKKKDREKEVVLSANRGNYSYLPGKREK